MCLYDDYYPCKNCPECILEGDFDIEDTAGVKD